MSEIIYPPSKSCSKCRHTKPLECFSLDRKTKSGYYPYCKLCRKMASKERLKNPKNKLLNIEKNLKKKFGISLVQWDKIFESQNGCCKICDKHQLNFNTRLCVDHCHKTGKIRGLLCDRCNKGLGMFNDREELLLKAIQYLKV